MPQEVVGSDVTLSLLLQDGAVEIGSVPVHRPAEASLRRMTDGSTAGTPLQSVPTKVEADIIDNTPERWAFGVG